MVVVHHPDVGALGLRLAVARRDLDEAAERLLALVDLFVELAVDLERRRELDGADGRLAVSTSGDDLGRNRRGRPVNGRRALGRSIDGPEHAREEKDNTTGPHQDAAPEGPIILAA